MKKYLLLLLVVFLTAASCKKDDKVEDDLPNEPKDEFVFDVDWTANTVYFDENSLSDLVKVDTANYRYYFKDSNTDAAGLSTGNIIVIHGLALRKVVSVSHTGSQYVVTTEYATMNEAIENGKVEWDYGVNFKNASTARLSVGGKSYSFRKAGTNALEIKLSLNGYDYLIKMELKDNSAHVTQTIEKKVNGNVNAKFICEGDIKTFRVANKMKFENAELTSYSNDNKNLEGELTVSLVVAGSGNDNVNFEFPTTILTFLFNVGPIPVKVNVKVLFVINSVVPGAGSSEISAKFKYNSSTGISYSTSAGVKSTGSKGSYSMEKKKAQTGAPGAISVNFGLGFPRIEVETFGEVLVPWAQTAFLIGGDYTFNPACQKAQAAYIGAIGYKLKFLGQSNEGSKTLWNETKVLLKSGGCKGGMSFEQSLEQLKK